MRNTMPADVVGSLSTRADEGSEVPGHPSKDEARRLHAVAAEEVEDVLSRALDARGESSPLGWVNKLLDLAWMKVILDIYAEGIDHAYRRRLIHLKPCTA